MKRLLLALALLSVAVPCAAAALRRAPVVNALSAMPRLSAPARIAPPSTVAQLRAAKPAVTPVQVAPVALSPVASSLSRVPIDRTTASKLYSQGSGVLLDGSTMRHPGTDSLLDLYNVFLDASAWGRIIKRDPQPLLMLATTSFPGGEAISADEHAYPFGDAVFQNLPTGSHTYLLTVGCYSPDRNLYLYISKQWHHDDLLWKGEGETQKAQLLLLLDGDKQDHLSVLLYAGGRPSPPTFTGLGFYYFQLAQVD